jgi:aspartyl-tRNA(Asn)/glutamyl-tRNA(Gln) amidotransferase subunit C
MPPADRSSAANAAATLPEKISPEHVRHLADLARLDFSEQEIEALTEDLGELLGYAQQLDEVDTEGVEPIPPGAPAVPERLRPDDAEKPLSQSEALENAPDADEDGFFQTPGALES